MHEGRSAHRSGIIKPGDVLAEIDGVALAGGTVAKLTQLMLGPPGSFVQLTLHRGAQTVLVWLIRSPSKLTPLQVNQQRERQVQATAKTRGAAKGSLARERSAVSRLTEASYLVSQSSFASIDDDQPRELGGEQSWDPDTMATQVSMVMSEASFDPERLVMDELRVEQSFDPERAMHDGPDLTSERSFDPEMLVQMSEKSFDPERMSMISEKSFDPDRMGFMSEQSMSHMSQKSFDPEAMRSQHLSEPSFDPEFLHFEESRLSVTSGRSFDADHLHSEPSRLSLSRVLATLPEASSTQDKDCGQSSQTSDDSFDPESAAHGSQSGLPEQSFDAEADGNRPSSASSERSFDPEARAAGTTTSVNSHDSFGAHVHGTKPPLTCSPHRMDPDDSASFRGEAERSAGGGGSRMCAEVSTARSSDIGNRRDSRSSVGSAVSYDPQMSLANSLAFSEPLESSDDDLEEKTDPAETDYEEDAEGIRHEMSRLVIHGGLASELSRAIHATGGTSEKACPPAHMPVKLSGGEGGEDKDHLASWRCLLAGVDLAAALDSGDANASADAVAQGLSDKELRQALLQTLDAARAALVSTRSSMAAPGVASSDAEAPGVLKALTSLEALRQLLSKSMHLNAPVTRPDDRKSRQGGLGFKYRRLRTGFFQITELKPGGAAMLSGQVRSGDTLTGVDGVSTQGLTSSHLGDILIGPRGSVCTLEIQRAPSHSLSVALTRKGKSSRPQAAAERCPRSRHPGTTSSSTASRQPSAIVVHAGFGFTFKKSSRGEWRVSRLKPHGFALTSGLIKEADVLVSIDGKPCKDMSADDMTSLIRGPVDSKAKIQVRRTAEGPICSLEATRWLDS